MARANGLIFFPNNKDMFTLHIDKDKVRENLFLSVTIDLNNKFHLLTNRKRAM
jgi:hypothetical protein